MRMYVVFISLLFISSVTFAADSSPSSSGMRGDINLTSHYVEHGLSQTDKAPALQGSFLFNLGPQLTAGIWGSNTNYPASSDDFNLRGIAQLNITISATSRLTLIYQQSQFYNGGARNGNILGGHLTVYSDYRLSYDSFSNWEGLGSRSTRFGFAKSFTIFGSWIWDNDIGYNDPKAFGYNSYFDARTSIGSKFGPIFLEGAVTGTSEASQFNGTGDFFFILSAKTAL